MSTNFHITAVREGTIFNVMQFLSLEQVTGVLNLSFGSKVPSASMQFVSGSAAGAEFGALMGDAVLDLLLCQEYALKEINFVPGRVAEVNEAALIVKAASLSGAILQAAKDVDRCQARPFIYGLIPVNQPQLNQTAKLLQVLHDFAQWESPLAMVPPGKADKQAPLPQCVLLHRALSQGVMNYQTDLIPLKSFRALLEAIQPLTEQETKNLRSYMRSLLPHPRATHMALDRFYAFASAVESLAHHKGTRASEQVRRVIHDLIQTTTKPSAVVSAT